MKQETIINEKCFKCGNSQYNVGRPFCTDNFCNKNFYKKPKQETIEEASIRAVKSGLFKDETLFIAGAKWQQERSYSKEEVFKLLMDFWMEDKPEYKMNPVCVSNWFNHFKKK